jgi:hypothetical protein
MGAARFNCPRVHANISTVSCGNRHHLARHPTSAHIKEQLSGCSDCPVGDANLNGRPMPSLDLILNRPKEPRMEPVKKWSERTCARDKQTVFTPQHGQQKACGTCPKCIAASDKRPALKTKPSGNGKPVQASVNGNGRAKQPTLTTPIPVVADYGGVAKLLERFGFRDVQFVDTPAGRMLVAQVSTGPAA